MLHKNDFVNHHYDVLVIGAGVAGSCIARELARSTLSCAVLEAGNDVAFATSRANSGIVHAGFDPLPGSLKARYCARGSRLFASWAAELEFGYEQNGSLVVAFTSDEVELLRALEERAHANDVTVELLDTARLREMEPQVSKAALAALYAPTSGICDPYGLAFAAAENAAEQGVEFYFNQQVVSLESLENLENLEKDPARRDGGGFTVATASGTVFTSRMVVNAAGVFADELNNQLSAEKLSITPVRGEYLLYDTPYGATFSRTMFQAPSALGKGILVTPTIHGNLIIGPNAVAQESKTDVSTSTADLESILAHAQKTWPDANLSGVITNFAGLRAKGSSGDFVIGEAPDVPGLYNVACFESPGLTAAPAVAVDIAEHIITALGAELRDTFNPRRTRSGRKLFAKMTNEERAAAIALEPEHGEIVCRCCTVSRADIVFELKGILPVLSLDTLKWRTGALMGRCHGGFCAPELMRIVQEHTGLAPEQMDKRLPGSPFVVASSTSLSPDSSCLSGDLASLPGDSSSHPGGSPSRPQLFETYDVLVIGAGAAGIAAAVAAAKEGAARVALLDRENFFGGILRQCIHNGFGLTRFKKELTGPEYATREAATLAAHNVTTFLSTTVLSIEPATGTTGTGDASTADTTHSIIAVNQQGFLHLQAKALVLATGSRERGQGALNLAGSRPAGVFSAGSAQNLINLEGCLPGRKVLIQGSGDIGLIMARRCLYAGAEVLGVFARSSKPSGLTRNVRQCLDDYGIPFYGNKVATRLEGEGRLEAVWISATDPNTKEIIPGSEERWECDTLLLSIGLLPENELASTAGIALDARSGGPLADTWLQTSAPGVFVCGNALHIHDLADHASEEGERAGRAATRWAQGKGLGSILPPHDASTQSKQDQKKSSRKTASQEPVTNPDLTLTCVRCPKSCELLLKLAEDGSLAQISGHGCKLGLAYAEEEIVAPKRIVTASLPISGTTEPLSVKTAEPVLREHVFAVLSEIQALELHSPVTAGALLIDDVAATGVAVVATKTV